MARYEGWREADARARLWKGRPPHSTRRLGWWSKTPFSELKSVLARQAQTRAVGAAGDVGSGEEPLGGEARRLTASRRPGLWPRELGWAPGLPGSRGRELPGEEPPSDDRQAPRTGGRRQHALGSRCPRAQAGLGGRGLPLSPASGASPPSLACGGTTPVSAVALSLCVGPLPVRTQALGFRACPNRAGPPSISVKTLFPCSHVSGLGSEHIIWGGWGVDTAQPASPLRQGPAGKLGCRGSQWERGQPRPRETGHPVPGPRQARIHQTLDSPRHVTPISCVPTCR